MLNVTRTSSDSSKHDEDLASLASQAAVALDNLVLGRGSDLAAVKRLADVVCGSLETQPAIDLTTAVAVHHALVEMSGVTSSKTVDELRKNAMEFIERLSKTAEHESLEPAEIKNLRDVCVALSRSATALAGPLYDRPTHQLR